MTTNVKATSVQAYRQTAPQRFTQRETVARYILQCTKEGRRTWRRDIARALQLEVSSVAGRVKEIEKSGIELDGQLYRIIYFAKAQKDPVTGVASETFGLCLNHERQFKFNLV